MKRMLIAGACAAACLLPVSQSAHAGTYTQTKYPIMLVHGIFGFDNFLGADYFYQIPGALTQDGAKVFVYSVSAANSNEIRGEQLLAEVKKVLAQTGATKVNLIGHSQGSPTARYVAGVRPDLVASVTSVDGVNQGSRVADIVRGVAPPGSVSESVASSVANGFAQFMSWATGSSTLQQNSKNALDSLTTQGQVKFNAKFPQAVPTTSCGSGASTVNGIRYYSWGGGQALTNVLDPADAAIGLMSLAFSDANDGLVSSCSQKLGQVIRVDYKTNHLDAVNGFFGIVHLFETSPVTLYREHANRLKNAGL